jgi:HD superfamily phosphodiesterase
VQEIIEKTKKFVLEKYSKYDGKFGPQFMKIATIDSIKLANELSENINLNKTGLLLGIYLHDIGRIITDTEEHTIEGKKIAEIFLIDNGIRDEETFKIVFDCILNHGSKASPITIEGKLVQFIDKAVLINPELIKIYFESLLKNNDKKTTKEIVIDKLDKWYTSLGERKNDFIKLYNECLEMIDYLYIN